MHVPWVRNIPLEQGMARTPILLPGKSHGQMSLVGYNPWGHKELDMTEQYVDYTVLWTLSSVSILFSAWLSS